MALKSQIQWALCVFVCQTNMVLITNLQDKRNADIAIEKAVAKLRAFEEELEGLRIDVGHANEDL